MKKLVSFRTILPSVLCGLLLTFLLAAPSTAFANSQMTLRASLDSDLSASQRVSYAQTQYNDYTSDGLTGFLHVGEVSQYLVLQGPGSALYTEYNELKNNWRTTGVTIVSQTTTPTHTYDELTANTDSDVLQQSSAASFSNNSRVTLRAKISSGTNTLSLLNDYSALIGADQLGGVMIVGRDDAWIEVELEGKPTYVEYYSERLQTDEPRLSSVTVVDGASSIRSTAYDYFQTHHSTDTL